VRHARVAQRQAEEEDRGRDRDVQHRARCARWPKEGGKLLRVGVGDRYVVEAMRQKQLNLGGDQSGHLVFLDHATTARSGKLLRRFVDQGEVRDLCGDVLPCDFG
jgi:hypothetical protein